MLDADTGGWLVANRTSDNEAVLRLQSKHRARLAEIRAFNKPPPSKQLAHRWSESPYGSKPHYSHVSRNAKRAQVEGERHQAIERDNLLLLQKMTTLLSSGASSRAGSAASSRRDPTVGTWEFAPGVRLNRNQVPGIDHCVSPDPAMPQRGAARLAESLNGGARRRELERITRENLAIVQRIQGRGAHYPRAAMHAHAAAHSRYLQQLRRRPPAPASTTGRRRARARCPRGARPPRAPPPPRPAAASCRTRWRFVRRGFRRARRAPPRRARGRHRALARDRPASRRASPPSSSRAAAARRPSSSPTSPSAAAASPCASPRRAAGTTRRARWCAGVAAAAENEPAAATAFGSVIVRGGKRLWPRISQSD